jgi:bacterioferritin (cytochrome b1)
MSTKEVQEQIVENMKNWKKIENASVASTGKVIEKTDNPIVRLIMEIIQRDSQMHYRIQELIIDSLEKSAISLTLEELGEVWDLIEKHIDLEKKTIDMAKESLEALKGRKMVVQEYLLDYLQIDEEKHNAVLDVCLRLKKGCILMVKIKI